MIPLRDIPRCENWFEHVRNVTRPIRTARDGRSTAALYLFSLVSLLDVFYIFQMTQVMRAQLRLLLPHLDENELTAACEHLELYLKLVVTVSTNEVGHSALPLTESPTGVSVNAGMVDPTRTFTNTG